MSFHKQLPGPGYQPVSIQEDTAPASQQPVMMCVPNQQPVIPQPMMVMYSSGAQTALVPQPVTFVPMTAGLPYVVKPQNVVHPNTHLVLTFVIFVLITLFAPEALLFLIPALGVAILSHNAASRGDYGQAKKLGNGALALNFLGIIFAFIVAILCVSLSLSLYPWQRAEYYYYYGGGCFYDVYEDYGSAPAVICVN